MTYAKLEEMLRVGDSYTDGWRLTADELETLSADALVEMSTCNGDTGTIEITVKQFAQLLSGYAQTHDVFLDEEQVSD